MAAVMASAIVNLRESIVSRERGLWACLWKIILIMLIDREDSS